MLMPHDQSHPYPLNEGVRRLAGFFAGALVVLPLGWGLVYLAYTQADRVGVPKLTAAAVAAAVSLVVFLVAENRHRLSRLMGLEYDPTTPSWVSAGLFWLLGPAWVVYKVGTHGQPPRALLKAAKAKDKAKKPHRDALREAAETVAFVVVLVLLLKLFVVEAFVIPTGSMAETLFGYKKVVTCDECGHTFPVNASREAEPQPGSPKALTTGYCCPNCRYADPKGLLEGDRRDAGRGRQSAVDWTSGDRVLVGKFLGPDERGRVVVFKFPDAPQTGQVAQNYIKRLVGFGGETIAIFNGDLYVTTSLTYPGRPQPPRELDRWRAPYSDQWASRWTGDDFRHPNADEAVALFERSRASGFTLPGGFELVRKPDDLLMAMRRLVYDNDHQSKSLVKAGAPPRWAFADGSGWAADDPAAAKAFTHTGGAFGWVRYRHLLPKDVDDPPKADPNRGLPQAGWQTPTRDLEPRLITNFLGYNAGFEAAPTPGGLSPPRQEHLAGGDQWCGDLMLECAVTVADPAAAFAVELSKGTHRYRAEFDGGAVRLKMFPGEEDVQPPQGGGLKRVRQVPVGDDGFTLATRPTGITTPGTYAVRFANADGRLRVWVDDVAVDFGGKADYPPPPLPEQGWTKANDLDEPAGVGAAGGVTVSKLKLYRDTHYLNLRGPLDTYYVQPGHFLCMGDNSAQSSDGRMWGLVPERLMLGRAVFVFYPFDRIGFIK
jgi:signal peptidase I